MTHTEAQPFTLRSVLTGPALLRLGIGWGAFAALLALGPALHAPVPAPLLIVALLGIVAVILYCAFGVVHEAEHLARKLGDPYGSLVLTLSIVIIEVVLIAAVMLGPGEHATIARDSVMAVSMIILNLMIGLCLLLGGLRNGGMRANRTGVSAYLGMLVVLLALAFGLPSVLGGGQFGAGQQIAIIALTVALYAFFLFRQMGSQAGDFVEVGQGADGADGGAAAAASLATSVVAGADADNDDGSAGARSASGSNSATPTGAGAGAATMRDVFAEHGREIATRFVLLIATVMPIVLLSHDMAALLDDGLARLGAPTALAGLLIAMIVFLPESITAVRAALGGQIQRVVNLNHGALVSTVGLTIPAVLVIGLFTGQSVVLAESPVNLLLLGASLLLSVNTYLAPKVTAMHGAAHLVLFAAYTITIFA